MPIVISTSSMVGMWIYIAAMLVAVVAVFWIFGHRVEMNISTMILGFAAYFVFDAMLLNTLFDNLVVGTFSQGLYQVVISNPAAFVPYYTLTRGVFYLLGMYVASRMSMKTDTAGGGAAIGIGFIFGYGIMNRSQGAWTVFQTWRSAMAVNKNGGLDGYIALMQSEGASADDIVSIRETVEELANTDVSYYLVSAVETLLMLGIFFALAVVIHLAVTRRAPKLYLVLGCVLMVVAMLPTALFLGGAVGSRIVYEILLALVCGGCIALAAVTGKKYMSNPMKW